MLSVETLQAAGVNTQEGLTRCMNNEAFYLRMVGMGLDDNNFDALETAVNAGDLKAAFEAAHALKGVTANLALTPILKPVEEITELLRVPVETDYAPLLAQVKDAREKLLALKD